MDGADYDEKVTTRRRHTWCVEGLGGDQGRPGIESRTVMAKFNTGAKGNHMYGHMKQTRVDQGIKQTRVWSGHKVNKCRSGHKVNKCRSGHKVNKCRSGHKTNKCRSGHKTNKCRSGHT